MPLLYRGAVGPDGAEELGHDGRYLATAPAEPKPALPAASRGQGLKEGHGPDGLLVVLVDAAAEAQRELARARLGPAAPAAGRAAPTHRAAAAAAAAPG